MEDQKEVEPVRVPPSSDSVDGTASNRGTRDEDPVMGPGGDSRPDTGEGAGWISADDPIIMPEDRGLGAGPTIVKPDPDELKATRVGDEDEVVGKYNPATGNEDAVLRSKT